MFRALYMSCPCCLLAECTAFKDCQEHHALLTHRATHKRDNYHVHLNNAKHLSAVCQHYREKFDLTCEFLPRLFSLSQKTFQMLRTAYKDFYEDEVQTNNVG